MAASRRIGDFAKDSAVREATTARRRGIRFAKSFERLPLERYVVEPGPEVD
jgi:hypothetical protein